MKLSNLWVSGNFVTDWDYPNIEKLTSETPWANLGDSSSKLMGVWITGLASLTNEARFLKFISSFTANSSILSYLLMILLVFYTYFNIIPSYLWRELSCFLFGVWWLTLVLSVWSLSEESVSSTKPCFNYILESSARDYKCLGFFLTTVFVWLKYWLMIPAIFS